MKLKKYAFPGLTEDEMPIGGYVSPTPVHPLAPGRKSQITDRVYRQVKESGINFLCATYEILPQGEQDVRASLELAGKYGIKMLIRDDRFFYRNPIPENYQQIAEEWKKYPGYGGIHACDEPAACWYPKLREMKEVFQKAVGKSFCCYINLFPMYADEKQLAGGEKDRINSGNQMVGCDHYTYENYIDDYLRIVQPEYLSYDYYPMQGDFPEMMADPLVQLDTIRRKTVEAGIPFWVFIQATSWHKTVRFPTIPEMMWQISTALAYGAKGVQYFSYATPINGDVPEGEGYTESILDANGNPTQRYYYMQYANRHLRAIQHVMMNSDSLGVLAVGTTPREIAKGSLLNHVDGLSSADGKHLLIGVFDNDGKKAFYVVNNSITERDRAILELDETYLVEQYLDDKGIQFSSQRLEIELPAGEGVLIVLKKIKNDRRMIK